MIGPKNKQEYQNFKLTSVHICSSRNLTSPAELAAHVTLQIALDISKT